VVLVAVLALLSAVLFAGGRDAASAPRPAARRLLRYLRHDASRGDGRAVFARADRLVLRMPFGAALERTLAQAGAVMPVSAFLLWTAAGVSTAAGLASALVGTRLGVLAAPVAAIGAHALLQTARGRRTRRMETQLPGVLDMLVGQLRSHRSIGEAISDVAQWIPEPLGGEWARLAEELRLGEPLPRALERLRDRVPASAVPALATAIAVADRTGANLAECLIRQAAAARAQIAFRHEVSALTAHARATGATLAFLPVIVAGAMVLLDPGVFAPMLDTAPGRILLGAAAVMEFAGWQIVRWMIRRVEP
jgi:tight adherence protein B